MKHKANSYIRHGFHHCSLYNMIVKKVHLVKELPLSSTSKGPSRTFSQQLGIVCTQMANFSGNFKYYKFTHIIQVINWCQRLSGSIPTWQQAALLRGYCEKIVNI